MKTRGAFVTVSRSGELKTSDPFVIPASSILPSSSSSGSSQLFKPSSAARYDGIDIICLARLLGGGLDMTKEGCSRE